MFRVCWDAGLTLSGFCRMENTFPQVPHSLYSNLNLSLRSFFLTSLKRQVLNLCMCLFQYIFIIYIIWVWIIGISFFYCKKYKESDLEFYMWIAYMPTMSMWWINKSWAEKNEFMYIKHPIRLRSSNYNVRVGPWEDPCNLGLVFCGKGAKITYYQILKLFGSTRKYTSNHFKFTAS